MPFMKGEDLRRLTGFHDSAEYELDLCGLDLAHARASVERMLERSRFRQPRSVVVRIDPASPVSGETLFQPIGRMLLEAMRAELVTRCSPLPEGEAGFWVRLKGNTDAGDDDREEDATARE